MKTTSENHGAASALLLGALLYACAQPDLDPPGAGASGPSRDAGQAPEEQSSGKQGARGGTGALVPYPWHDGDARREAWLDPELVAEHRPSPAGKNALARLAPGARELASPTATVRLWQLSAADPRSPELCAELATAGLAARFSPVFHPTSTPGGARTSLAGGVLVAFRADLGAADAEAWIASRGLRLLRRIDLATPAYVLDSPPGLAALELANELHADPATRWATPDWWLEPVIR